MAKRSHVTLGEDAGVFYDPLSKFKVLPGKVVELTKAAKNSSKVKAALKGGHLEYADPEDADTIQEEHINTNTGGGSDDENEGFTYDDIPSKKANIIDWCVENFEVDEDEFDGLNKDEVVEKAKELVDDQDAE